MCFSEPPEPPEPPGAPHTFKCNGSLKKLKNFPRGCDAGNLAALIFTSMYIGRYNDNLKIL